MRDQLKKLHPSLKYIKLRYAGCILVLVHLIISCSTPSAQGMPWTSDDTYLYESFKNVISGDFLYFVMDSRTSAEDRKPGVDMLGSMGGEPVQIVRILLWSWEPDDQLRSSLLTQWRLDNKLGQLHEESLRARLEQVLNRYDAETRAKRELELTLLMDGNLDSAALYSRPQSRERQAEVTGTASVFFKFLNEESLFSTDPARRKMVYESMPKIKPVEDLPNLDTNLLRWLFLYESDPANRAILLDLLPDPKLVGDILPAVIYEHLLNTFSNEERTRLLTELRDSRSVRVSPEATTESAESMPATDVLSVPRSKTAHGASDQVISGPESAQPSGVESDSNEVRTSRIRIVLFCLVPFGLVALVLLVAQMRRRQ